MLKVPTAAEVSERWAQHTTRWAHQRASQRLLVASPPAALWVFEPGLRKISRRAGHTATISLSQQMLRYLGAAIGDHLMLVPGKHGTLTMRKATAKDLRQANPYTRLAVISGKKGKKVGS